MSANVLHGIFYGLVLLAALPIRAVEPWQENNEPFYPFSQRQPESGTAVAGSLVDLARLRNERLNITKYGGWELWWQWGGNTNKSGPYDSEESYVNPSISTNWGHYIGYALNQAQFRQTIYFQPARTAKTQYGTTTFSTRRGNRADYQELLDRKVLLQEYNGNPLQLSHEIQQSISNGAVLPGYMVRDFDGTWRTNSTRAQYATGKIRWRTVGAHQPTD